MGEIAEALERAKAERARRREERAAETKAAPLRAPHAAAEAAVDAVDPIHEVQPVDSTGRASVDPGGRAEPQESAPLPEGRPGLIYGQHNDMELSRQIAHRVASALERRGARSMAVVSPLRGEGKSTVACNIAIGLASLKSGREVALLDLDLRRPTIGAKLEIATKHGVERVLQGRAALADVCAALDPPAFDVYAAREPQRSAHELLVLPSFAAMMGELKRRYATVIVDTPPVLLVPDANLILRHVDCCVPLARSGVTKVRSYRNMVELLPRQRILGELLNGGRPARHTREYYYYYGESTNENAR